MAPLRIEDVIFETKGKRVTFSLGMLAACTGLVLDVTALTTKGKRAPSLIVLQRSEKEIVYIDATQVLMVSFYEEKKETTDEQAES